MTDDRPRPEAFEWEYTVDRVAEALNRVFRQNDLMPDMFATEANHALAQDLIFRQSLTQEKIRRLTEIEGSRYHVLDNLGSELRLRFETPMVYGLDFSEIYAFMHRRTGEANWGNTVEYFLRNWRGENLLVTIPPAACWELLCFLKNISERMRNSRGLFSVVRNSDWANELYTSFEESYETGREKYTEALRTNRIPALATLVIESGRNRLLTTPFTQLREALDKKWIVPSDAVENGFKKLQDRQHDYDDLFAMALKWLERWRPLQMGTLNNKFDARYFADTRMLNVVSDGSPFFCHVSRGTPLRMFTALPWLEDPLVLNNQLRLSSDGRAAQYGFYRAYLRSRVRPEDRVAWVSDAEMKLSIIAKETIDVLRSIAGHSGENGLQEPKDHSEEIERQRVADDTRALYRLVGPSPSQADEDEAAVINCLFQDEEQFRKGCREAEEQIRNWAIRLHGLLGGFQALDERLPQDPDIVELRRWLGLAKRR